MMFTVVMFSHYLNVLFGVEPFMIDCDISYEPYVIDHRGIKINKQRMSNILSTGIGKRQTSHILLKKIMNFNLEWVKK